MYKTVFNNASLLIILVVATMLLGIGAAFLPVPQIQVNLILLLAVIPVFLVASVALYPKGDLKLFITTTSVMLVIFVVSMLVISGVCIGITKQVITGFELSINPLSLVLPLILSVVIAKLFVTLDYVELKPVKVEEKIKKEEAKIGEQAISSPVEASISIEEKPVKKDEAPEKQIVSEIIETEEKIPVINEPLEDKIEEDVFLEDIMGEKSTETTKAKSLYDYVESDDKPKSEPEIYFEDLMEVPVKNEKDVKSVESDVPIVETFDALGDLPDLIDRDNKEASDIGLSQEHVEEEVSSVEYKSTENYVVPKLSETPISKDQDGGGKITSIGKLLVDHRDIENIIETNALMQSVGSDMTTTKIISAVAGSKINDKLSVLGELDGIEATVIVDNAGFVQASTLKDLNKEQILGAMASGTFGVISSTLNKMGFQPAKDITLKSDSQSLVLNKLTDNIVTLFIDSKFPVYDTNDLAKLLSTVGDLEKDKLLEKILSVNGLIGTIISDEEGKLITSKLIDESKNPEIIASMLPSFYSNLGVFIKNMDQGAIIEAIISTGNEMIFFTKVNTNIIMLYVAPNTSMQSSDLRIQYEAIINNLF